MPKPKPRRTPGERAYRGDSRGWHPKGLRGGGLKGGNGGCKRGRKLHGYVSDCQVLDAADK